MSSVGKQYAEYGQRFNIWKVNTCVSKKDRNGHPAPFPEQLANDHIISWSNEGDTVFDPFMGVGSTAIAALINGRKSIGAEIMPEYIKIANKRIALAEKGELRIRPMERSIYDPNNPNVKAVDYPTGSYNSNFIRWFYFNNNREAGFVEVPGKVFS